MRAAELKQLRLGAGLTQRKMAKTLGMTVRTLSRYETGVRRVPQVLAIAVRCVVLHRK